MRAVTVSTTRVFHDDLAFAEFMANLQTKEPEHFSTLKEHGYSYKRSANELNGRAEKCTVWRVWDEPTSSRLDKVLRGLWLWLGN